MKLPIYLALSLTLFYSSLSAASYEPKEPLSSPKQVSDLPISLLRKLRSMRCPLSSQVLVISVEKQRMELFANGQKVKTYRISTGAKGVGQKMNSYQTPLGMHRVVQKIGDDAPIYTIFEGGKDSGKIWDEETYRGNDPVLSRVFLIEGLEPGFNAGRNADGQVVDSMQRKIYIHGTHEENLLGSPASHGCIRMSNRDVVELFGEIEVGTLVWIER